MTTHRVLTAALIAAAAFGLVACKNTDTKLRAASAAPAGAVAAPAVSGSAVAASDVAATQR